MADTDQNAIPANPATPQAPDPVQPQILPIVNVVRNRIPAVMGQNNLINVRQRLFHEIYFKVALTYATFIPAYLRRGFEYFILFKALIFFAALVYLHMAFIKNPATCLQHIKDWPRDGVLRVEVIPNLEQKRAALERTKTFELMTANLQRNFFFGIGPQTKENQLVWRRYEQMLNDFGYGLQRSFVNNNETVFYYFKTDEKSSDEIPRIPTTGLKFPSVLNEPVLDNIDEGDFLFSFLFKRSLFLMLLDGNADEQYIVEYSLEYGHLRLSAATRKRLQIPVRVVQLDPMKDKCFGDSFSKFMLRKILGYDDLLMASVRVIAEQEDNKGYLRHVITGEHYRFVSIWWAAWSSYPTAFSVMLLFTFSISMLLRFSHHQIFVFIVDLIQMLEFNITARFPIAPLLTVILALVGMEAIMSEFFNDATTAFYIILIVWIADQFDAICCHTAITKRHWLRFFYLYHFAFYAYHHRFNGQNRNLSLITSWLFIQHSMVFFFHRYELPVIVQQAQIIFLTRNQPNAAAAAGDAGVGAGAGAIAGAGGAGGGVGPGGIPNNGDGAGGQQQQQPQFRQGVFLLRQQPIRILPVRNRPTTWESIQRSILQRGWRPNLPIRVQIGNVHRNISLHTVQQNVVSLATTAVQTLRSGADNFETSEATNELTVEITPTPRNNASSGSSNSATTSASAPGPASAPAAMRNAADGLTSTAANSRETNAESNENATIPSKPSSSATVSSTANLDSTEGHNGRAFQVVQHFERATGGNHNEQPECIDNNKIEKVFSDAKNEGNPENYVDVEIMQTSCYDAILATTTIATEATTKEGENEESIKAQRTTGSKNSSSNSNNNNNNSPNEQLENDLYAIVKGDMKANGTEYNKAPQESSTEATIKTATKITTTKATTAAAGDELKPYEADPVKEIVRKGLTANPADMLQPINQTNIENSELMGNADHIVATTSAAAAATAATSTSISISSNLIPLALKRNENLEMIDSVDCRYSTRDDDKKTLCDSFIRNENKNSEIISTKHPSTLAAAAAAAATKGGTTSTELEFSSTIVNDDQKNISSTEENNVDRRNASEMEHQHSEFQN